MMCFMEGVIIPLIVLYLLYLYNFSSMTTSIFRQIITITGVIYPFCTYTFFIPCVFKIRLFIIAIIISIVCRSYGAFRGAITLTEGLRPRLFRGSLPAAIATIVIASLPRRNQCWHRAARRACLYIVRGVSRGNGAHNIISPLGRHHDSSKPRRGDSLLSPA